MPGRDGTGPMGLGAKGLGGCAGLGMGSGLGCRRGYGRGYRNAAAPNMAGNTKELLTAQKELLERRLDFVSRQLESM